MEMRFTEPLGFEILICRGGGYSDVRLGDPELDRWIRIRTDDAAAVQSHFLEPRRREALRRIFDGRRPGVELTQNGLRMKKLHYLVDIAEVKQILSELSEALRGLAG
jgi:hypothetical protein